MAHDHSDHFAKRLLGGTVLGAVLSAGVCFGLTAGAGPAQASDAGRITGDVKEQQTRHLYSSLITSDIPDNNELNYELYIGPMKYSDIKQYDEHAFDMVEVGYAWLRWFSNPFIRFIVIPFFTFFSGFISNYGILIIILFFLF